MANADRGNSIGTVTEVENLEAELGRTLDISHRFFPFGAKFRDLAMVRWDLAGGRIPLITVGPGDMQEIADGEHDDFLRHQAQHLASLGSKVFFRFAHEMDGDYRQELIHSPEVFIAAWRHVHDLFVDEGATNAVWVWCPTAWGFTDGTDPAPPAYYPGSDYVDWVAADAYNWFPHRDESRWVSLRQRIQTFYNWALTTAKPLMVAEFGAMEDTGDPPRFPNSHPGRKAFWIDSVRVNLSHKMPAIQAVIYFDTERTYRWNIRSSDSSMAAWRTMAHDGDFNPHDWG